MYVPTKNGIFFNKKIIISGNMIEVYLYEKAVKAGYQERKKGGIEKEIKKEEKEENDFALRRARSNIRRLVTTNFNKKYDKFITLTFKENMQDITKANREFTNFIKRLKRKYCNEKELKYLNIIEFQKRGAIHYHMLANLPYIESKKLEKLWGNGFIKINAIHDKNSIGAYISKYLTKETYEKKEMKGKKKYFPSRNLKRPIIILDNDTESILEILKTSKITITYQNSYQSDYNGKITYIQYNVSNSKIKDFTYKDKII